MTDDLDLVVQATTYLEERWPDLLVLKTPGTRRRWTETVESRVLPEGLRLDGGAPLPIDVSVLDVVYRVHAGVEQAVDGLLDVLVPANGGNLPPGMPREPVRTDPRPHLVFIRRSVRTAQLLDDRTAPWLANLLGRLRRQVATVTGDARVGQTLAAICPWCGGRSETAPAGGMRTLQVVLPDDDADEPLIVCTGTNCTPGVSDCGMQDHGRPAWPEREWDWLAKRTLPTTTGGAGR